MAENNEDSGNSFPIVRQKDGTEKREGGHYPIDGPKRMDIFNFLNFPKGKFKPRVGSEKDVHRLVDVFQQMGYKTNVSHDLQKEQFLENIHKLSKEEHLSELKIFILVILSHGDGKEGESFVTSDEQSVDLAEVRELFNDTNCPQLKGKPKIFLADYCRNESKVIVEDNNKNEGEQETCLVTKDCNDMIAMHSCKKYKLSVRSRIKGTRFIVALCQAVADHARHYNLHKIYQKVQENMAKRCSDHNLNMEGCDPDIYPRTFGTCYLF